MIQILSDISFEFESPYAKQRIYFYPHEDGKRFLFKVHRAMDEFVLDAAKEMNVNVSKYGYPDDLNGFKRVTKSEDASENPKLRQLFGQIRDYPELVAFRNTLKYLVNQKYDADTEIAKQFFDGRLKTEDLMQYLK